SGTACMVPPLAVAMISSCARTERVTMIGSFRGLPPQGGGEMIHVALFGLKFGCTTAPSRVSAVAFTMSSSQLIESALVFLSISTSRNASRFLAYRLDAVAASRPGTLL